LSVTVLSATTPTKQKDAWLPLHVPANLSTRYKITKLSAYIKAYFKDEMLAHIFLSIID